LIDWVFYNVYVFFSILIIDYVLIYVTALKSQLDEQNKRNEERDKRLDAIMNFFSQNYQS